MRQLYSSVAGERLTRNFEAASVERSKPGEPTRKKPRREFVTEGPLFVQTAIQAIDPRVTFEEICSALEAIDTDAIAAVRVRKSRTETNQFTD